jgi:hypothetical protein
MSGDLKKYKHVNDCNGALNRLWTHTANLLNKWNGITVAYEETTNVDSWNALVEWKAAHNKNNEKFRNDTLNIELKDTGHGKLDLLKAKNKHIIQQNYEGVQEILRGIPENETETEYLNSFTFGEIQGGLLQKITRQSQALGLSAYEAERNAAASKSVNMGNPWNAIYKLSNIVEHISRA